MIIGVPKEIHPGERRVAIVPSTIGQLKKLGHTVIVEKDAGIQAHFPDVLYRNAGAEVVETPGISSISQGPYTCGSLPCSIMFDNTCTDTCCSIQVHPGPSGSIRVYPMSYKVLSRCNYNSYYIHRYGK